MSNDHYLVVSYFVCGAVSLGVGSMAYRIFRAPFAAITELLAYRFRSALLKRVLSVSLTMAAVLGFLSVSYTSCGKSYEQIVNDREYMVEVNRKQLQSTADWVVYAVFAWGVVVVICLAAARKKEPEQDKHT